MFEISKREQWRYYSGTENPTDMPSRGVLSNMFPSPFCLMDGPLFLQYDTNEWSTFPGNNDQNKAMKEKMKHSPIVTHVMLSESKTKETIDSGRFSNKNEIVRTLSWVL